jgi:hypothetical protein
MPPRPEPEYEGAQLSGPSELSGAKLKSNAAKDVTKPGGPTVIRQPDSLKDGKEPTVGPTVAANSLKSDASDSPDSPDSENPTHSVSDKPG